MKLSRRKSLAVSVGVVSALALGLWGWTPNDLSNPNCQFTHNAAWVSVDWTSQPIDEVAVQQLVLEARHRKIRYLFPYVSYLKNDGAFSPSYAYAAEFVNMFRAFDDEIRILAWIGLPLTNTRAIGVQGWVDLSQATTRQHIVDFIGKIVEQAPFDGVHINAETVSNNDPNFLALLDEIRIRLGAEKLISVAGSHWVSDGINQWPGVRDVRWTSSYYRLVGQRVNQIATMTYDSYMPHAALYRLWMREQVKGISASLGNTEVELLIGLSVSHERTRTHQPRVENLESGLAGICVAISDSEIVQGVAIYADWEFSQADRHIWETWQR